MAGHSQPSCRCGDHGARGLSPSLTPSFLPDYCQRSSRSRCFLVIASMSEENARELYRFRLLVHSLQVAQYVSFAIVCWHLTTAMQNRT
jgi:hypothetical protein